MSEIIALMNAPETILYCGAITETPRGGELHIVFGTFELCIDLISSSAVSKDHDGVKRYAGMFLRRACSKRAFVPEVHRTVFESTM